MTTETNVFSRCIHFVRVRIHPRRNSRAEARDEYGPLEKHTKYFSPPLARIATSSERDDVEIELEYAE